MAITTLNNRSINRSDTASSGQLWTATSATASDFQAAAAGGKIGQVVQTVKTDTFTTTSTGSSFVDITGLTVDITPTATNSKILIFVDSMMTNADLKLINVRLVRDSTAIYIGDAASNRNRATRTAYTHATPEVYSYNATYLDSPSTTSATTYKMQMVGESGTSGINYSGADTDAAQWGRSASSITVMEVLA